MDLQSNIARHFCRQSIFICCNPVLTLTEYYMNCVKQLVSNTLILKRAKINNNYFNGKFTVITVMQLKSYHFHFRLLHACSLDNTFPTNSRSCHSVMLNSIL